MENPATDQNQDLASVIVPTYNRASLIVHTLNSIRSQTYRPIEVIIVDDGSIDDTQQRVEEWCEDVEEAEAFYLVYLWHENSGVTIARNRGFEASHGEYIQFLDSDDLLHEEKLTDQIGALQVHSACDFAFSRWEYFGESIPGYDAYWADEFRPHRDLLINLMLQEDRRHYLPLHTGSTLYRREFCRELGGWDEDLSGPDDVVYNIRVLISARDFCYVPRVQMFARKTRGEHVSGLLSSAEAAENYILGLDRIREILANSGHLTPYRRFLLGKSLFFLAWAAFAAKAPRAGEHAIRRALTICPASTMRLLAAFTRWLNILGVTASAPVVQAVWKKVPEGLKRAIKW